MSQVERATLLRGLHGRRPLVGIPVTADVESGYGRGSPEDVAATVHATIDAGVVGINLEDGPGAEAVPLLPPSLHAERIAVARATAAQVGVDIVINARTDVFLRQVGHERDRLSQATDRANLSSPLPALSPDGSHAR